MFKHLSRNLIFDSKLFPICLLHPFSSLLFSFPAEIWFLKLLWHLFLGLASLLFSTSDHALLVQQYLLGFIDYFLCLLQSNWSFCPDFGALLSCWISKWCYARENFSRALSEGWKLFLHINQLYILPVSTTHVHFFSFRLHRVMLVLQKWLDLIFLRTFVSAVPSAPKIIHSQNLKYNLGGFLRYLDTRSFNFKCASYFFILSFSSKHLLLLWSQIHLFLL